MRQAAVERAAEILVRHRLAGPPLPGLPEDCRPADAGEAYLVQQAAHRRLAAAGRGPLAGRKIGCTTPVMQAYLSIPHPCGGAVFADSVAEGRGRYRAADYVKPGVECEIAVRLAADLPGRGRPHDRESVAGAVGAMMAAIELVDERYADWPSLDAHTLTADDFFNAGAVLAPPVAGWRSLDLAGLAGEMWVNGASVGRGTGGAVLGHPLNALAWLADTAAAAGMPLKAGEFVLLGSVVKTFHIAAGDEVRIAVDGLGEASLALA